MTQIHRTFGGIYVNALTGEEWTIATCPICGFQDRWRDDPETGEYEYEVLKRGKGMITEEEAQECAILSKTPAGRMEVARRIAQEPAHAYMSGGLRFGEARVEIEGRVK